MIRNKTLITMIIFSLFLIQCENKKKKNYIPIQSIANVSSPATPSSSSQPTSISNTQAVVGTEYAVETFSYQTTRPISIDALVVDGDDKPITGAMVEIRDSGNVNSVYQQLTNTIGRVIGSITLNTTETKIFVYVTYKGLTTAATTVVKYLFM